MPAACSDANLAQAFGLRWRCDVALAPFIACSDDGQVDVSVYEVDALPPRAATWRFGRGSVFADGVRFAAGEEAIFDMTGGDRIAYHTGAAWRGTLPSAFFGTVVALTLAWRGMLPFHACAVEVRGKAVLIAGPGGAGKSSLTAGLVALGATFVADDLSAVGVDGAGFCVYPGRATMRLHRETAGWIDSDDRQPVRDDPRDKWRVRPIARTRATALPVAGMLLLGASVGATSPLMRFPALRRQLFRPRWLAALPNHAARLSALALRAPDLPLIGFPALAQADAACQRARAHTALAVIDALARS